jgi:ArsR family transcriptional regulator, arsenate/arsenite/antimonite-responsive transcriptional repressor
VVNLLEESPARSATPGRASDSEDSGASPIGLSPEMLADSVARDLVRVFKVLSDATRLRIIYFLLQADELHVRALCELLSQSQPAVSHHLALLRVAGLIESRRQGKHNFYRLLPAGFHQLLDQVYSTVPAGLRRTRFEQHVLRSAFPEEVAPSPQR